MKFPFFDPDYDIPRPAQHNMRSDEWWGEYRFYHRMKAEYYDIYNRYHEESRNWWDTWRDHAESRREASCRMGAMKIATIRQYAQDYICQAFIETGTFHGETTLAVRDCFEDVYTVEIEEELFNANAFKWADTNVHAYLGDSKELLPSLVQEVGNRRILFWLDAHWCGGGQAPDNRMSPVQAELEYIFSLHDAHIVLIDDARYFGGLAERDAEAEGYPDQEWVKTNSEAAGFKYSVAHDIIRLVK